MNDIWSSILGVWGIIALIAAPFIINKIIKFKLEIAKINSETTIKAEEIRAKNQLEIERLVHGEKNVQSPINRFSGEEDLNESPDRIKRRV